MSFGWVTPQILSWTDPGTAASYTTWHATLGLPRSTLPSVTLDPTNDVVFKHLMTRAPVLLHDMLQAVLTRPIGRVTIRNPHIPGQLPADRGIIFDVRATVDGGRRVDLEMQRRSSAVLASRLVYYAARDYADQLNRGDQYHLLTPTTGIVWLVQPLFPHLNRLHSRFELREPHLNIPWGDQLSIHLLQLSQRPRSPTGATGYTAQVERWARFFTAQDDGERRRLALEDPIMSTAVQTLETLSLDPTASRLAREREDQLKLHQIDLAMTRAEGETLGQAKLVLKLLGVRFGPLSASTTAQIMGATAPQLECWAERVLTASTLGDVLDP